MIFFYKKQFKKEVHDIVFDTNKKQQTQAVLVRHMQQHPVRVSSSVRYSTQNSRSSFLFLKQSHMFAAIAVVLTLALGGGVYAAEGAVPGDALYPVKVSVNEEVRERLSLSGESKAHWNARVAERRLEEATELSVKGALPAEVEARLKLAFEEKVDAIEKKIAELKAEGKTEEAAKLSSRLEGMLDVQERVLARIASSTQGVSTSTRSMPLLDAVRVKVRDAQKERVETEASITSTLRVGVETAAQNRVNEATRKIAQAREQVAKHTEKLGTEATAKATLELNAAAKVLVEAETALKNKTYAEAFALASKAHRMAAQIPALIRVHIQGNGRVSVPEVLEDGEKKRELEIKERSEKFRADLGEGIRQRVDHEVERAIKDIIGSREQ